MEVAAQGVACLLEQATGMFSVAVRPKVGGDLVATQPARVRGKQREKGKGLPLRARPSTRSAFLLYR